MIRALAAPAAAAALVLLTGAGQASDGFTITDASADQVAAAYAKARPGGPMHMGQWDRAITIAAFDLPGMAPGADRDAAIAKAKEMKKVESVCHSGTDLAAPEPAQIFEMLGTECHYQKLTMGGGKFDGTLSCQGDEPGSKVDVAVSGTYAAESFAIRLDIDQQPEDPAQRMKMTMLLDGHRTGECKPG
ncbi:DUF3617 family protein [Sphingomonas sp. R-74633]|uniref:DUF3617 domain-containing protein n=1 Tax=Sphingomonas sp. R-74633 TaxID=2751188 RepID=UPI0015D2F354|nr:DUF3617 family protein [Sphingomonas sp. R-74633]NYT42685.1 DUF3617 family protein [Sphingomonas sp. R-74633]